MVVKSIYVRKENVGGLRSVFIKDCEICVLYVLQNVKIFAQNVNMYMLRTEDIIPHVTDVIIVLIPARICLKDLNLNKTILMIF